MATVEASPLDRLRQAQHEIVARLARVRRRVRVRLLVEGLAILLAEAAGLALLAFWADHTFRLGVPARIGLLVVAAAVLIYETWRRLVGPVRWRLSLISLAGALGRHASGGERHVAARVASVMELPRLLEGPSPPSAAMVERAVDRCHSALAGVNFDAALDRGRIGTMWALMAAALLIPAVLVAIFPEPAGLWARRLFLLSHEPWPQNTYLEVADLHDGRIVVPRGEPYVLKARAHDGSVAPDRITLTIRSQDKTSVLMKEFGKNDFRHDFAVVEQPLELELEGGDDDFGPILLEPVDRPRITNLELTAQHPRQKEAEKHSFNGGDADLTFLVKTRLALAIAANVPLAEMRLKPQSKHPAPADLHRLDATHFLVQWNQEGPAKFDLELVAADSGLVSIPVPVSIGLKVDQPPRITLAYSGVHPRITAQAKIPLTVDARDDFGLAAVALAIKDETPDPADAAKLIPHSATQPLFPLKDGTAVERDSLPPELQFKPSVDVGAMKLPVGALVSLTADATDDCYTGPQTTHSRTVTFRIVPAEELFREILQRQQAERVRFRKQLEEAEKLRDAIGAAADAKQVADLTRRQRGFQRETLRILTSLTESLAEIKLNGLGTPESHELMQRNVLNPLTGLQNELVGPQTAALDALTPPPGEPPDPAKVQVAAARQDQITDRMKTILKQMAQWDSFVDVLNQLDQIIKLETQVKEQTEQMLKKETEGLFDK